MVRALIWGGWWFVICSFRYIYVYNFGTSSTIPLLHLLAQTRLDGVSIDSDTTVDRLSIAVRTMGKLLGMEGDERMNSETLVGR